MAQVVKDVPQGFIAGRRQEKYPWNDWFDGRHWRLNGADDYPDTKARSFVINARATAKRRGGKLDVWYPQGDSRDASELVIQFQRGSGNGVS